MSPGFVPDPEEQRRQAEAHLLLLRVGLALIDDARRTGAFETDEEKLSARVDALAAELGSGAAPGGPVGEAPVRATPLTGDRLELAAAHGESSAVEATLRADGVLLEQGSSTSVSAVLVDEADLSPEEAEEMQRAVAEFEAKMAQPRLSAERFLRAIAAAPQPGSEVQVLAA